MDYQDDFSPQEWQQVLCLPLYCAALVITGDLSGLPGLIQESQALYRVLEQTRTPGRAVGLAQAAAEMLVSRQTEAERLELVRTANLGDAQHMLAESGRVVALINNRLPGEVRAAYYDWVYELAVEIAQAAREGGFLGLGGAVISAKEQGVLDRLASLLQIPPGGRRP